MAVQSYNLTEDAVFYKYGALFQILFKSIKIDSLRLIFDFLLPFEKLLTHSFDRVFVLFFFFDGIDSNFPYSDSKHHRF